MTDMEYSWTLTEDATEDNDGEEPRLRNNTGRTTDYVGGIDNDALDFSQLEDFINNEDEVENTYFVESLHQEGVRTSAVGNATIVVVETAEEASPIGNGPRLTLQASTPTPQTFALSHNLPDSPPDSGSEPPYSPQQDADKNNAHGKHGLPREMLLQTHPALYSNLPLKSSHMHPVHSPHLHEPMLMQHPVLTPLLSASIRQEAILNRPDGILLGRNEAGAIVDVSGDVRLSRVLSTEGTPPVLIHSPPSLLGTGQPTSPVHTVPSIPHSKFESDDSNPTAIFTTTHGTAKKRKISEDTSGPVLYVKQELESNLDLSPESNSSHAVVGDDGYDMDGVCVDANFQCIRFQQFQQAQWHVLCDQNLKELPMPHYRVDADKGFNFSNADDAFVCQKKNHFQITCHTQLIGDAQFIKTPEGVKKVTNFYIHFYGVKVESPSQTIKVEQSQSDRSKKPFHPVLVEVQADQVTKVTVGRLHFSETTSNNMRKKGKPNPDQRYFYLVVGLHAHTVDSNYQIVAYASERIIVRASNPGQFESDVELCWQKGHTQDSIFHAGRVGINTDRPDECLVVHGNLKVTGHIVQPSDLRAKLHLQECNTKEQLKNIEKLRVVRYRYAADFAEQLGIEEDTGVIAQEVQRVLPDAVKAGGDVNLPNGHVIQNFLVVNKDRIFMENVGAVKELVKVTDNLGKRMDEVEKMNKKLAKLKKVESFRSDSSISTISSKIIGGKQDTRKQRFAPTSWLCSNRAIHIAIGVLVVIMACCLAAMATLYFLQTQQKHRISEETNVWKPTADPSIRQNNVIRTQTPKRGWSLTTTLSNLFDVNKTMTTLSSLTEPNRTHHGFFNKEPRGGGRKTTHGLFSSLFHRTTTTEAPTTEIPIVDLPMGGISSKKPLGRPRVCTNAVLYGESDTPCNSYCCGDGLVPTAVKVPLVQDPYDDDTSAHTKHNEVEGPPPAATNTIDHGQRPRKQPPGNKRPRKGDDIANVTEKRQSRARRNTDDGVDSDNANLYPPPPVADQNGVVVTVYGKSFSQNLTSDFCSHDVTDMNLCQERTSNNYSYNVPISRYYPENFVFIKFKFFKGHNDTNVCMCDETLPSMETCAATRAGPDLPGPPTRGFSVDVWRHLTASIKYRVPIDLPCENVCKSGKEDLGISYLEYNLYFYRDCEE